MFVLQRTTQMTDIQKIDNEIAKLANEHKLIADYVAKFSKGKSQKDKAFFSNLQSFFQFLKKDLLRHFELEELVIFPAAVNGAPSYETTLAVLHLQKDHGRLENQFNQLLGRESEMAPQKLNASLVKEMGNFFENLKNHAKYELTELFPAIDQHNQCKNLIEQYLDDLQSKP